MSKLKEEWKPIKGYEGLYEVSDWGRVKSLERDYIVGNNAVRHQDVIILKPWKNGDGYLHVLLSKNGKRKTFKIHRFVAEAFIPNPNNYEVVHHKDHNKLNNKVENLEWKDRDEHDNEHGVEKGKQVYQYTLDGVLIRIWQSAMECDRCGFNHSHIIDCCNGKRKTSNGHKWSYEPL